CMKKITGFLLVLVCSHATAGRVDDCLLEKLKVAAATVTAGELRAACESGALQTEVIPGVAPLEGEVSRARFRMLRERDIQWSSYVLTAHKQNYILPWTHAEEQNPIYVTSGDEELAEQDEAKFQLSIKVPLTDNSLFVEGDSL